MKVGANKNQMNKLIHIILTILLSGWMFSISNISINELDLNKFGPFHFMPVLFWILFIGIILVTVYLSQVSYNIIFIRTFHIILIGLLVFGTLSAIEPYGRSYPDAYVNVNLGELIFQHGTTDFGSDYPQVYPSFYLFMGIFQVITGFSFSIVRFFPIILLILYLFGIVTLVYSISDHFKLAKKDEKMIVVSFTFLAFTTMIFSLGVRTDPSPQTFAIVLAPFFISSFIQEKLEKRIVTLIILFALFTTHMMTSFIVLLLVSFFLLSTNRELISRILLPIVIWFGWVTYVGIFQLKYGFNYIIKILEFEVNVEKAAKGMYLPGSEMYVQFKLLSIILIVILFLISLIFLLKQNKKLSFILIGFVTITAFPIIFYFAKSTEFLTRVFEISSIYTSLIFGFGMFLFFKKYLIDVKYNMWSSKSQIANGNTKNFKIYLALFMVTIILFGTTLSLLTTRRSDVLTGTTNSEVDGYAFMLYKSNKSIFTPILPPINKKTDLADIHRIVRAWDDKIKTNAFNEINHFDGLIGISEQWIIRLRIHEKSELSSLDTSIEKFDKTSNMQKIYDNGQFITYVNDLDIPK